MQAKEQENNDQLSNDSGLSNYADAFREFFAKLPKAELHLHLEGTLEPETIIALSQRNIVKIPYKDAKEVKQSFEFSNLQEFLDLDSMGVNSMKTAEDFYHVTWELLRKINKQGVKHVEICWAHIQFVKLGVPMDIQMEGIIRALEKAKKDYGMSCYLIGTILKHLSKEDAMQTVEDCVKYQEWIKIIGGAGPEVGFQQAKFKEAYERARELGFKLTCHAGEEGGPEYVWDAIDLLKVDRVDHGFTSQFDKKLMDVLKERQIPLAMTPLSNIKQKILDVLREHPIKKFYDHGMSVSISSDDPSYFCSYVADNYYELNDCDMGFTIDEFIGQAKMSFKGSFLSDEDKVMRCEQVDQWVLDHSELVSRVKTLQSESKGKRSSEEFIKNSA